MTPSRLVDQDLKERGLLLLGIALASVIAWQTSLGSLLLYPFTILALPGLSFRLAFRR